MNEAILVRKLNEMFVVQTAILDTYETLGEVTTSKDIANKFSYFSETAKDLLGTLGSLVESFGGEMVNNVENISLDLKTWVEDMANTASFSDDDSLRAIFQVLILENVNHLNWSVLAKLAEENDDERLKGVKAAEGRVAENRGWLKAQFKNGSLKELQ